MGIMNRIKFSIMKNQIEKRKDKHPFNQDYAEYYRIPEGETNHPNNSFYFSLHDMAGKSLLFRIAQRGDRDELWFVWHDRENKTFYNRDMLANAESSAEVHCIESGKKWRFKFTGPLVEKEEEKSGKTYPVVFEGEFTATAPIFEFSRHMAAAPVARALAREKWDKDFVKNITENHQVHYEQSGHVTGKMILDGKEYSINMPAMRDHSFGKREWNYMDRHVWLTALMENGETLNVNMVRYPAVFELQTGYWEGKGGFICIDKATPMDELSLSGQTPEIVDCHVQLCDGRKVVMHCEKEVEIIFPFDNGDYTIYEGIGRIDVDGIKGRGIIEFGYNKDRNRWTR